MKITLYTTTNCQFSKQEKEYLTSHSLPFEEKNIDTNKQFLAEMMTVGNNFAGTPVTKIEKDDGTVAVLKGFTVEEFNTTLGFAEPEATTTEPKPAEPAVAPPQPEAAAPGTDTVPPAVETPPVTPTETPAPTVETPSAGTAPAQEPPLNDVLSQLETKINDTVKEAVNTPPAIPTVESPAPTTTPTEATPPPASGTPAIPDFPSDGTQPAK